MDECDRAFEYEDIERTSKIKQAEAAVKAGSGLKHTGICLAPDCEAEVPAPKLFCDGDCAARYDVKQRAMRRVGR